MPEESAIKLDEIAALLTALSRSAGNPNELAEVTFLELARLMEPDVFELGVFEANSYRSLIRVVEGTRVDTSQIVDMDGQDDLLAWVRKNGVSLLLSDFEAERDALPVNTLLTDEAMPASGVFVPLRFGDRVLGILSLHSKSVNAFDVQDRELLTIVASSIAPALATAGLAGEIELLTLQMLLIQQVSRLLMTLEPLSERMSRIVALLSQVL